MKIINCIIIFICLYYKSVAFTESIDIREFGAIPNDELDDTDAIIKAISYSYKTKGSKVKFAGGNYIISSIHIKHGVYIYSDDKSKLTRAKRMDKWSRMFTTYLNGTYINQKSNEIYFDGLTFDGNINHQGEYKNFELEHQAIIFISGNIDNEKRIKVSIRNCRFYNGVGDGIHLHQNVQASIKNCLFKNLFRGGVTITGGNTDVVMTNLKIEKSENLTGIDIEYDSPGYKNSRKIIVKVDGLDIDGDLDIGLVEGKFIGKNITCHSAPLNFFAPSASIQISNSFFYGGILESCRIVYPHNVVFENCIFNMDFETNKKEEIGNFVVLHNTGDRISMNNSLVFNNCKFKNISNKNLKQRVIAIKVYSDKSLRNNKIILKNCSFVNYTIGLFASIGGNFYLNNNYFDCDEAFHIDSQINENEEYNFNVFLKKSKFGKRSNATYINKHPKNTVVIK